MRQVAIRFGRIAWMILAGWLAGGILCSLNAQRLGEAQQYDNAVPAPKDILGFVPGERPARYAEVLRYFQTLAEASPRLTLVESRSTHEGRPLIYAFVSSEENLNRLEEIRADLTRLADPRTLSAAAANDIIGRSPLQAWLLYSIHGDELSGSDAALQVAYHLAAGTDSLSERLRRELVIGIYPMENPDGRERYLAQMQQWGGQVLNPDGQSIQHTGVWPWGRTNHYLFDLNRDWFILSQPESRDRVQAILKWPPQLVVDAHEMGAYDTYLFPPAREPVNHHLRARSNRWHPLFAADQARAFDQYGWSYYTREWLDDWYPGYGSSWPFLLGAVGILYEQAGTDGSLVKKPDGSLSTFAEAVQRQFVASLANLRTAVRERETLLRDFYRTKQKALSSPARAYYLVPGDNPGRVYRLGERLRLQGVEIARAEESFTVKQSRSYWSDQAGSRTLPEGTLIVPANQPLQPLIDAILEFDPRLTTEFLTSERRSLEKGRGTRMYEVSAWSLPLAFGVEAYVAAGTPKVKTAPWPAPPGVEGKVENPAASYGFLIDYGDDRAITALRALFDRGYQVRAAQKPFRVAGRSFTRGALLLRRRDNPETLGEHLPDICAAAGVSVYGVNTALSEEGPDLGGDEFPLLEAPRIAMLAGPAVDAYNLGAMWYLLDYELQTRISILPQERFGRADLRKYNVLVLPSARGGAKTYLDLFGKSGIETLKTWVAAGGTLIGIENGAAFLADSSAGLSEVQLRRQALSELPRYQAAFQRLQEREKAVIDSAAIWENQTAKISLPSMEEELDPEALEELDEYQRLFMPRGAILKVRLDEEHWLSFGVGKKVPAIFYSGYAYLAKKPVETAGRFGEADSLRLSGLLWPEARSRWENTAYLTRESHGKGQIILFAGEPNFRSYFYGTARLFQNALFLGPGLGTRNVVEW